MVLLQAGRLVCTQPSPTPDHTTHITQDDRFALKCPITQQLYEKPMKNRNCQHVYSQAGIFQALKNKQQARCPVPGKPAGQPPCVAASMARSPPSLSIYPSIHPAADCSPPPSPPS